MNWRHLLLLCLLLCLPAWAQATSVRATLDRASVQLGETVTLNLHVEGGGGFAGLPNLAPLQADFDVLGTSQSSSLSIDNGQRSMELVIGVVLRPRHAGVLTIPALRIAGVQSAPLQLTVTPAGAASAPGAAGGTPDKNVFMEAQLQPKTAWVGEQLSYVVRLYYSGNLTRGTLDTPQIDGVQLAQVGKDLRYDAVRGGRNYHVIERDYALTPQHAGTLQVPALGFQGEALDPNDPNSFFDFGTRVSASAPPLTVQVQAAPAGWGGTAWLPARALSLSLTGWPDAPASVRVGQPINLVMTLSATGLPATALPALSLPTLTGATVYPDQPKSSTANDGPWLVGKVTRAFAVVPTQAGTLSLPATTLAWFDVTTGKVETAQIPAHNVTVLPAAGVAAATPPALTASPAQPASVPPSAITAAVPAAATAWRWVALAALLLWLATVLAWWWSRRCPRRMSAGVAPIAPAPTTQALRQAFLDATRGGDAAAQLRCLMDWAQAERPQLRNAGELAGLLADVAQQRALAALQQRCYGNDGEAPVAGLAEAFARGFAWRSHAPASDDGLPPLYPFKL